MTVAKFKVTCFHDGECPICTIEINAMKKFDKAGNVKWVDITQDKTALGTAGLTIVVFRFLPFMKYGRDGAPSIN